MERSESITNIAKALLLFKVKVSKITKDSENPFFKSKYASLSHIQEAIQEPLEESGLVYSQMPTGQNGLCTILIHAESGEYFKDTYIMPVAKPNDPQAVGSSITYAKRYTLVAVLGLNIDDDDDGNAAATQSKPAAKKDDDQKPWLNQNTDKWNSVLSALRDGYTLDSVKKKYRISKENEKALNDQLTLQTA